MLVNHPMSPKPIGLSRPIGLLAALGIALGCAAGTQSNVPHPADWASLEGRRLTPIAATGRAEAAIVSAPIVLTFTRTPDGSATNMLTFTDGCNGYVSPGVRGAASPSLDSNGVLHVFGFLDGAVGCPGQSATEEWLAGFLVSGPRLTVDGPNVVFETSNAAITMADEINSHQ